MRRIAFIAFAAYMAVMVVMAIADHLGTSEHLVNALFGVAMIVGLGAICLFGWRGPGD
jgi:hypothetical protein